MVAIGVPGLSVYLPAGVATHSDNKDLLIAGPYVPTGHGTAKKDPAGQ